MPATPGDDLLNGTPGNDTIDGLAGNDTINGLAGNDTLLGNTGNDTINPGTGTDTVDGGANTDRLVVDYSANGNGWYIQTIGFGGTLAGGYSGTYNVNSFSSVAFTGIENFTITGTNWTDAVTTGDGNDVVNTGDGDDVVSLGKGNDSADGGLGTDGLGKDFSAFAAGVTLNLATGINSVAGGTYVGFEYFSNITGSAFADNFLGTGSLANEIVNSGAGNDTASFYRGTDVFNAGTGSDRLIIDYSANGNGWYIQSQNFAGSLATGYSGTYNVNGFANMTFSEVENFTITGTNWTDSIVTGDGNDFIYGGAGDDVINAGGGVDTVDGGSGTDGVSKDFTGFSQGVLVDLAANTSNGTVGTFSNLEYFANVTGTAFGDSFFGTGALANEIINSGAGNDTASFYRGTDVFNAGADNDRIILDYSANGNGWYIQSSNFGADAGGGYHGTYNVNGFANMTFSEVENFTITGTNWTDNIITGNGNDFVYGGDGNDVINAGGGIDTVDGGSGTDGISKDFTGFAQGVLVDLVANTSNGTVGTFSNLEYFANVTGTAFADSFLGTTTLADEIINSGAGNDTASFYRGNDVFNGGADSDRAIIDYSLNGNGWYITSSALTKTVGGGYSGSYNVNGFANLTFTGVEHFTITGTNWTDAVVTGDGNDVVSTGDGDDVITLGKGNDSVNGGNGTDGFAKDFSKFTSAVQLNLGINLSQSTVGTYSNLEYFKTIVGSKYGDVFIGTGSNANESIDGGAGDDLAVFYRGTDTFKGGTGVDTLVLDYSANGNGWFIQSAPLVVNAAGGFDGNYNVNSFANITFTGVEKFDITGTGWADTIVTGSGNDILIGGTGADTLNGGLGDDIYGIDQAGDTIIDAGGSDAILSSLLTSYTSGAIAGIEGYIYSGALAFTGIGDAGANTFGGGSGNDSLNGAGGIDKVTYLSASSGVTVSLALQGAAQNTIGAGTDTLVGFENLEGSRLADSLTGDGTNNSLWGQFGNDVLEGGLGDDLLDGGAGVDTASYEHAASLVKVTLVKTVAQVTVGAGNDTLIGIENLTGSAFNDSLTGDSGDNVLIGLAGNDTLGGGKGRDVLIGGDGADKLTGGADSDLLTGGLGADKFVFTTALDSISTAYDRIVDFSHLEGDKIDISKFDADPVTAGNQVFSFIGSAAFSAVGQVRAEVIGSDTWVQADMTGDGIADIVMVLTGAITLVGTDFIL